MMLTKTSIASRHFEHAEAVLCELNEGPLAGLRHRTVIDSRVGSRGLALWEETHLGGFNVPDHLHDCEEIIAVIEGEIEARLAGEAVRVRPGESILIPAGCLHGFRVVGAQSVKLLALFASPAPKILRADGTISRPPWEGGASAHLEPDSAWRAGKDGEVASRVQSTDGID